MKYDILIKNGKVIDGTGKPGFFADVAIKGKTIARIEQNIPNSDASLIIDGTGLVVSPGFIDVHCHTDWSILDGPWDDHQERQGITTQVAGLCGTSPLSPEEHFRDVLERTGLRTNYALMVGHGTIRKSVMGDAERAPFPDELRKMKYLTEKALDEGALGLSTGLIYVPGTYSTTEELKELAAVLRRYDAIYATHMRSESDAILKAVDEAIEVARYADVRLQISHIKVILPRNWGLGPEVIRKLEAAMKDIPVAADQYPYTVTGGGFYGPSRLVKGWPVESRESDPGKESEAFARFERDFRAPEKRKELTSHVRSLLDERGGPKQFIIVRAKTQRIVGMTLDEASDALDVPPEILCLEEILASGGQFAMVYEGVYEPEMIEFMKRPWVMVGTDGVPGAFHPRTHGTFPRILGRYVREKNVLSLEEAIRKMTSLPAETFGFSGRGRIAEGFHADLVIFDPESVIDKSDFIQPHAYPEGIRWVFVNGTAVVKEGQPVDVYPGVPLRRES